MTLDYFYDINDIDDIMLNLAKREGMKKNRKNVTLKDIAESVGVSIRTVSLAIQGTGRMAPATREKILKIAKEWNYHPNIMARGLVNQKNYLLGVIVPYFSMEFYGDVLSGIEEGCKKNFYDLLLRESGNNLEVEREAVERMTARKVDGIITYPDPRGYELYKNVLDAGIPLVQITRFVPMLDAPLVSVDNEGGTFMATSRLIELGHRNIGYMGSPSKTPLMNARRDGYRKALVKHGVLLDLDSYEVTLGLSAETGELGAAELLRRNPELTAIVCAAEHLAIGTVRGCLKAGKRVPEDISIIGFGDLDIARNQIEYPLTTVSFPKREIGCAAFDLFLKHSKGEKVSSVVLKTELIERATTAARIH